MITVIRMVLSVDCQDGIPTLFHPVNKEGFCGDAPLVDMSRNPVSRIFTVCIVIPASEFFHMDVQNSVDIKEVVRIICMRYIVYYITSALQSLT